MDHERVLEQIVGWATADDNIRVVVLTGSAALGPEHVHALSDLDVELYAAQPIMLLEDDAWYAQFGEVLVVESLPNPGWYPTRLVYYIDGKIDFMVGPVDALATVRYVRSFRVLLDKDRAADALPPVEPLATDPPTAASFRECIHWFYAGALMCAKCVVRDDPSPNLAYFLAELVRDGSVGIELVRPVPFLGRLLAQQGGETAFALPFAIATFPLAVLLGGMLPPASPAAAALYGVSFGLSYGIMVLIGLMIGLASFWTIEIFGFVMIYRLVSAFFGGALIPLWFFPSQLSAVADWLPFQSMLFVPIAIYLGQLTGGEAARALALQLVWILALYVAVQAVWRHAMRRVVVQGG